jgi:hypothetical protein
MRIPVVISLSILAASPLLAQSSGPLIDPATMLNNLQTISTKNDGAAKALLTQTLTDFTNAQGSDPVALDFYAQAVKAVRFTGRDNAEQDFQTWKKNVLPRMNPAAVRTTLRYTCICLQRSAGGTDDQMFPIVLAYVQSVQPNLEEIMAPVNIQSIPMNERGNTRGRRGQNQQNQQGNGADGGAGGFGGGGNDPGERIMDEDVAQNVFSKWYKVSTALTGLKDWDNTPSDIDGIYENFLMPIMRQNKDPRILDYWDNRIAIARDQASQSGVQLTADTYNQITRPALGWNRAEDEIAIGQRDQGLNDMYAIVKGYPTHPMEKRWIAMLEGMLTPAPTPTPPAVAAGAQIPTLNR